MNAPRWHETIERTVAGLGYDLVEVERAPRGLLRVTIDRQPGRAYPVRHAVAEDGSPVLDAGEFITVDDCETVTRQLQYALEVDGMDYQRLEVSSPGLDRPLKRVGDYARFSGQDVSLTLKLPFQGRKNWRGTLQPQDAGDGWRLVFDEGQGEQALDFQLDEVREAHLVPVLDFKGRGRQNKEDAAASPAARGGARGAAKAARKAGINGGQDR